MAKKLQPIQLILRSRGPMVSSDLAIAMAEAGVSVNTTAARKAIQRAAQKGLLQSTAPVRFDKVFLYYLDAHRTKGKGRPYSRAVRKLLKTKPSYNRIFKTILANLGWISFGQIGKASGCLPEGDPRRIGGRKSIDRVIADLLALGLIEEVAGNKKLYRLGIPFGSPSVSRATFLHKLRIEQELLLGCRNWIRNTFLIAYHGNTYRNSACDAEPFNDTYWDLHGPTYLGPFTRDPTLRRSAAKENFLLVDVVAYRTFSIVDAEAAIDRYKSIVQRWKTIAVTPIIISRSFSENSWNLLRKSGVSAILLGDVFGKNIDTLLQAMWKTVSESVAPEDQIDDVEKTLAVAAGTVDDFGLIGNLKGTLFEFLIALAWKAEGYDVKQQKIVRRMPDDEYEIDIVAIRSGRCKLIECKGHHATYRETQEELSRHFENRCEAAADPYGWHVTNHHADVEAIFVTSGELDDEAEAYAKKTKKSHGIRCTVQTRKQLLAWLDKLGQDHLCEILDKYYLDPLPGQKEDIPF